MTLDTTPEWQGDDPIFAKLIAEYKPKTVIEVGSWKGGSAISMGLAAEELGIATKIICVDTWLGCSTFYLKDSNAKYLNDLATVFMEFRHNIKAAGLDDRIEMLRLPSRDAARVLRHRKVNAELIYLDASHAYEDVAEDLKNYYPRLSIGGHLFGHDYQMPPVQRAVNEFAESKDLMVETEGNFWRLFQ